MTSLDALARQIRSFLRDHPELLKPRFRRKVEAGQAHPLTGHCYVASEAYYHARGGKDAGLKPVRVRHEGTTHWWIETEDGEIVDLTAEQFDSPVPYGEGRGSGFLTAAPSRRARKVLQGIGVDVKRDGVQQDAFSPQTRG